MKFTKFLTGVGLFITLGTVGLCSHLATDNSDYMYLVSNQSNAQPNDPNAQNTELITKLKRYLEIRVKKHKVKVPLPHRQVQALIYF